MMENNRSSFIRKVLDKLHTYWNTSKKVLGIIAIFDIVCILILKNMVFYKGDNLAIVAFITAILIMPLIRTIYFVRYYKKKYSVKIQSSHSLIIEDSLIFLLSITQFLAYFYVMTNQVKFIHAIIYYALIFVVLTPITCLFFSRGVTHGGVPKSQVFVTAILVVSLALLDQIESSFLAMLIWFLPLLLPIFIGEIYKVDARQILSPTSKIQSHLYGVQTWSFTTLVILNIFSAIVTKRIIVDNEIKEVNVLKEYTINQISRKGFEDEWSIRFIFSLIVVSIAVVIGYKINKWVLKYLKEYYLDSSKNYFKKAHPIRQLKKHRIRRN